MKVIVTGATGNVGTSTVRALSQSPEIDEIVGIARRRPAWSPAKTSWLEADVLSADLAQIFAGADAVIHLAWAIQPSRDAVTLERINVEGSRRVFDAVAAASVPKLVYASSVGAYSPGPKDREVDESWSTEGTPSSFYSRHKVAVEHQLNRFEDANPETSVVRLRPALIFKDEAATEIRRLFVGPFLPSFLLRRGLLWALPRIDRLRFQAVHSEDVGRAYLQAVLVDVDGPFNIAAEPPLSPEELAERMGVRSFPVPARLVRRLADLSWQLRLQPTPPGWLDMALNVPLMSSRRAREELGWEPRHSSIEALEELVEGMREGQGGATPPLEEDGLGARAEDLKTGVGARQWDRDRDEQLVKYLADVHSIERQALAQLEAAPKIAGDERLAQPFERHLAETEEQERRVRERLEALGAKPSTLKDAAGAAGGWAMAAFAASQPDTPGKLAMHAYSYEHMELAAYELLRRLAERSGDEATASMAADIAAEEGLMAERLEERFDAAVEASLAAVGRDDPQALLLSYLRDAHALEGQAIELLESGAERVDDEELERGFREHLRQTQRHRELIEGLLEERDAAPSTLKDAALKAGGLNLSAFFGAQPDSTTKLAGFAFAFEHLEVAAYELLKRVATRAGDESVVAVAEEILAEERAAAERVAQSWNRPGFPSDWRHERRRKGFDGNRREQAGPTMKALTFHGKRDVRVDEVPDPRIEEPTDAIVRITSTAICGSDLHLYEVLGMFIEEGDVLGHEPMGIVEEVGSDVTHIKAGDRVVIPFNISCGHCWMCDQGLFAQCETTQVRDEEKGAALFGYTKLYGEVPGGQAEYLRVPQAQFGPIKVPENGSPDERYLFLSDVLPTAWQAVEYAAIPEGGSVAVFGLGPIGQMSTRIALHKGAGRVFGIDRIPERLAMAERNGVETIDFDEHDDVSAVLRERTDGRGPDSVIEAVGMEAHGAPGGKIAQAMAGLLPDDVAAKLIEKAGTDRMAALLAAIDSVRRGGTLSISGVYGGMVDPMPMMQLFDKGVQVRMGQAHVRKWTDEILPLLEGDGDPLGVDDLTTHQLPLAEAPGAYEMFQKKEDGAIKVVLKP